MQPDPEPYLHILRTCAWLDAAAAAALAAVLLPFTAAAAADAVAAEAAAAAVPVATAPLATAVDAAEAAARAEDAAELAAEAAPAVPVPGRTFRLRGVESHAILCDMWAALRPSCDALQKKLPQKGCRVLQSTMKG